jgi:hypothetical protein
MKDEAFQSRACLSSYLMLCCMLGFPFLLWVALVVRNWSIGDYREPLVAFLPVAFVFIWLRAFRICITDNVLKYRTLWHRWQSVPLSEIKRARDEFDVQGAFKPAVCLVVRFAKEGVNKKMFINLKVFSRADVRKILDLLHVK